MLNDTPTTPDVFIIESLAFKDEHSEKNLFEGQILSDILSKSGISSKYYYIRTETELKKVAEVFHKSSYRYLHISCHGSPDALHLTFDSVPFKKFAEIFGVGLRYRRVFLSACSCMNDNIAEQFFKYKCYSIIGPHEDIGFSDAAIMWASFYHLVFRNISDDGLKGMNRNIIKNNIQKVVTAFGEPMNYYYISRKWSEFDNQVFL